MFELQPFSLLVGAVLGVAFILISDVIIDYQARNKAMGRATVARRTAPGSIDKPCWCLIDRVSGDLYPPSHGCPRHVDRVTLKTQTGKQC